MGINERVKKLEAPLMEHGPVLFVDNDSDAEYERAKREWEAKNKRAIQPYEKVIVFVGGVPD